MVGDLRQKYDGCKHRLDELTIKRNLIDSDIESTKKQITDTNEYIKNANDARLIVQTVAESLQRDLEFRISSLVSMALAAVFPDPYEFLVQFVQRRNTTEADLLFAKNGNIAVPLTASGGGAVDIAAFALKISIWTLDPTENTLVFDEPFRFVSRDLQDKASEMLKMVSEKLGIQIILISHIPEIIACADNVIDIDNTQGVAYVRAQIPREPTMASG